MEQNKMKLLLESWKNFVLKEENRSVSSIILVYDEAEYEIKAGMKFKDIRFNDYLIIDKILVMDDSTEKWGVGYSGWGIFKYSNSSEEGKLFSIDSDKFMSHLFFYGMLVLGSIVPLSHCPVLKLKSWDYEAVQVALDWAEEVGYFYYSRALREYWEEMGTDDLRDVFLKG